MSSNPFGNSSGSSQPTVIQQQIKSRERVKITFYGILGVMVAFCLTLLFQGCKSRQTSAELPPAETLIGSHDEPASTSTIHSSEPVQQSAVVKSEILPPAPTPVSVPAPKIVSAPIPAPEPIPVAAPAAVATPGAETYTIKKGDTLTGIAKSHGISIAALKQANNLSNDRIVIGKKLKIPTRS